MWRTEYFSELAQDITFAGRQLVANPGCYPTTAILALAPFIKAGLVDPQTLIVDSKSGVSGAGRTPKLTTLYPECNESISAYSVGRHRHTPEIEQILGRATGQKVNTIFTPHLVPMDRGILSTIYVRGKRGRTPQELHEILLKFYAKEPFVHVLPFGETPHTRHVRGSNMTMIGVVADRVPGRAIVISALDNLVKGASGQAIQNMNLVMGYPETMGIDQVALFP